MQVKLLDVDSVYIVPRVCAGETVERDEWSEGLAIVPNRCISRARAGVTFLDRLEVHQLYEAVARSMMYVMKVHSLFILSI